MEIRIIPGDQLGPTREKIFALCERAYLQDLRAIPGTFDSPTHVLGIVDGAVVSHALWITRWLAPGTTDPTDLVRRSFAFLLEREPKESILGAFDLTVIGRYFPDWEAWIRG